MIEVPVEPNRLVKKGDVLFRIDPTPYQLAGRTSLEAQLANAQGGERELGEELARHRQDRARRRRPRARCSEARSRAQARRARTGSWSRPAPATASRSSRRETDVSEQLEIQLAQRASPNAGAGCERQIERTRRRCSE